MKKYLVLISFICACTVLSGCGLPNFPTAANYNPKPDTAQTTPAETAAPVEAVPAAVTDNSAAAETSELFVSFNMTTEEAVLPDDPDGKLYVFSYSTPKVRSGDGLEYSELNEQLALYDELFYSGDAENPGVNALHEASLDAYSYAGATSSQVVFPFYSQRSVAPQRVEETLISLLYTTVNYTGGSEDYTCSGMNYEPTSGKLLTLSDVADVEALKALFTAEHSSFAELKTGYVLKEFTDDPAAVITEGSWYLTNDSFVIMAPSSLVTGEEYGVISFVIPLAGNENVFRIAPKSIGSSGKLVLSGAGEVQDGTFEIRDFIQCGDGMDVFLTANGTVYDLCVSRVIYSDGEFYVTDILWKSSSLTDAAIQLRMVIPQGMPDIMISYSNPDGTVSEKFIVENGSSAEVLLINNISSVG